MYIQPYEPAFTGAAPACTPETPAQSGDPITTLPWTDQLPELGDAAGALNDAPLGSLGIGSMLTNLTGMMQQLVQMMQSLLGRMNGETGNPRSCNDGGCTQGPHARS